MIHSLRLRQTRVLVRSACERLAEDPVNFLVLVSQRLPRRAVELAGRCIGVLPGDLTRGASAWLTGDVEGARRAARTTELTGARAAALGELSLRLGDRAGADRLRVRAGASKSAQRLRARILWHDGEMTRAVGAAPEDSPMQTRMRSEKEIFASGWLPHISRAAASSRRGSDDGSHRPLWSLVNSVPHTQSGYALRSHSLLKAIADAGAKPAAITRTGYPTTVGRFVRSERETVDDITYWRDLPGHFGRTPVERVENQAQAVRDAALAHGASVIHTTTHFVNGLAAQAAAEATGLPWVYEVRGSLEDTWAASLGRGADSRYSERYRLFRERETEVALAADRVIVLGETMAAELAGRGIPERKIHVVPNAVGSAVLEAAWDANPADVRSDRGLPEDGVWVGTAASIVGYEGLDVLVDAVSEVRREGVDLRLLIAGDGEELGAIRHRARRLGEAAVFTGRLPQREAHEVVRCLDIAAVPRRDVDVSRLVTPLKPVELAGLGRPVVLSDLPALAETLPGQARRLVRAGDVAALASALAELAVDRSTRQAMALAGRRFVEAERTWAASADRIMGLYSSLTDEERSRR